MYDPKCEELAEYFLQDEPALKADIAFVKSLAQDIQTMLEDSIELRKSELREEKQNEQRES